MTSVTSDQQLAYEMAKYYDDPLGFVMATYRWGEKGTPLENEEGPDANQKQFLIELGALVQRQKVPRHRSRDANSDVHIQRPRHRQVRFGSLVSELDNEYPAAFHRHRHRQHF